ncbi:hypothetical protein SUGI_0465720 [Cryptomeria japonica]|nr:hypothetical protein SUGI_0465720 [Cryptomeria japonica]
MESRGTKRKVDLLRLPQDDVMDTDPGENRKRPSTGSNDNEDEFNLFSALLGRIQEMKKLLKSRGINCSSLDHQIGNYYVKVVNRSAWKPCFEWEDFYSCSRPRQKNLESDASNN